jgi:hypothetical protein
VHVLLKPDGDVNTIGEEVYPKPGLVILTFVMPNAAQVYVPEAETPEGGAGITRLPLTQPEPGWTIVEETIEPKASLLLIHICGKPCAKATCTNKMQEIRHAKTPTVLDVETWWHPAGLLRTLASFDWNSASRNSEEYGRTLVGFLSSALGPKARRTGLDTGRYMGSSEQFELPPSGFRMTL